MSYPTDPADAATIAYLREYISACRTLDDYNPFQYQQWYASNKQQQGGSSSAASGDPAPANCRQVGPALPDGTLPLASIACDNVPLVGDPWGVCVDGFRAGRPPHRPVDHTHNQN